MVRLQLQGKDGKWLSLLHVLAVAVLGGCSLLFASFMSAQIMQPPSIGSNTNTQLGHRQLGRRGRGRNRGSHSVGQFSDPKTVEIRIPGSQPIAVDDAAKSRKNCQVVYIMGVEGATHHGVTPIIEALAKQQFDPESGHQYWVDSKPIYLKDGLFGWTTYIYKKWGFPVRPEIDDPDFVKRVVEKSCPADGRKHVLIEWASFPSGEEDDPRYRVQRHHDWQSMSPDEIADDYRALQQPLNVTAFVQAYSPYVDIKFVVIHRPFLETIASHYKWDGGAVTHSNVIHGFLLILRRFLDAHPLDLATGGPLWTLLCLERIMSKNYEHEEDVEVARRNILSHLADFLGWPVKECKTCFNQWHESTKNPYEKLGKDVDAVLEHAKQLEGVWPPPGGESCRV